MSALNEADRESLFTAFASDFCKSPCCASDRGNAMATVEDIVARHVAEALDKTAARLEEVARTPRMWMQYPEAARIVREVTA